MAIKDYTVIVGAAKTVEEALAELRREVITGIRRDWQPLGGVSIELERMPDDSFRFVAAQAMGKTD